MKHIQHISLALLILLTTGLTGLAQETIPWIQDLSEARRLAEQQQRLVLLHFWGDGCPPCQQLEANVFNQPELIRVVSMNFIPVKIHVQQQAAIANHYKIRQIPTDVVVLPSGVEVYRTVSPAKANSYVAMLDQVRASALNNGLQEMNRVASKTDRMARNTIDQFKAALPSLPPRQSEDEPTSQAINSDLSASGSLTVPEQPAWQNAPTAAPTLDTARNTVVNNDFVGPLDREAQSKPTTSAPRYGNPYLNDQTAVSTATAAAAAARQPPPSPSSNPGPTTQTGFLAGQPAQPANQVPADGPLASPPAAGALNNPTSFAAQPQVAAAQAPQAAPQLPPNVPPLALDGFCPVTLLTQQRWEQGNPQFGAIHRGRTYFFRSQLERDRFLSPGAADQFAPVLSGYDPVRFAELRQSVAGAREHGVVYQNQIYLFADEQALTQFEQQPDRYVNVVRQAMSTPRQGPPQR